MIFYHPETGNIEVWESKPEGYLTEEEGLIKYPHNVTIVDVVDPHKQINDDILALKARIDNINIPSNTVDSVEITKINNTLNEHKTIIDNHANKLLSVSMLSLTYSPTDIGVNANLPTGAMYLCYE